MNARLSRAAFAVLVAVVAMMLQASCARSVTSDDTSEPPLFGTDAGAIAPLNACVQTECPPPWATCPGGGLCATDTTHDVRHCGSCATPCPAPAADAHASALCAGSKCTFACDALYADCNHLPADGCETSTVNDPLNCGFCGNICKEGVLCWRGACGCPNGYTQCGDDCKKLDSDDDNCGSCGNVCKAPASDADPRWSCGPGLTPAHTEWKCLTSACTLDCKPPFGNCNKDLCADGCEIDLTSDPLNCGACGNKCEAGQDCVAGACICPLGTTRCGDECVDVLVDVTNCGGCGHRCPGPAAPRPGRPGGGSPACAAGQCTYTCFPGFADCDGDSDNGCEANLTKSQQHCGTCATKCNVAAGQPCVSGQCLTKECDAGVVF
jgi:hypothetical protein